MPPKLNRCPVCDALPGAAAREVIANQGFVACVSCSHQVRWTSVVPEAEGVFRVRAGVRDPSVATCDRRMSVIQRLGARSGHLLELGCGAGRFLLVARARGFDVSGIESDDEHRLAARDATGLAISSNSSELAADARFEVVAAWCSLAFTPHPLELLGWCAQRMRPGAVLALSIPHPDHALEAGTIQRFTRASLTLCALRAGFELLEPAAHYQGRIASWWRSRVRDPELYARLR